LLLSTEGDDAILKIADFGLAKHIGNELIHEECGTPYYLAPDQLISWTGGAGYGLKVDVWAVGVCIYIMLSGYYPFFGADGNIPEMYRNVLIQTLQFPTPQGWNQVSNEAKLFLMSLLEKNPSSRLSCKQALDHPWIKSKDKNTHHLAHAVQGLKGFNARNRFRSAVKAVVAMNRFKTVFGSLHPLQHPAS